MVHLVKLVVLASAALLPVLAAPLNAEPNDLVAREPVRSRVPRARVRAPRRGSVSNVANRVSSVVSRVGSTAGRVSSIAGRVGSVVSRISSLFGRELDSDEELFLRELLEEFDARAPQPEFAFDELDAREPAVHPRELEDEMEAREWFGEELD